ncbi:putative transcription factor C2H2 family [Helianthus debilis subsp. tardiflorus]
MGCFCLKRLLVNQPNKSPRREIGNIGAAAVVLLRALERFEAKPKSEQEDILIYLSISWKDLQRDSSVIEALKETGFVTSGDGDLYKPKDLFDPGDALLTSLFSGQPHKFPGERFVSDAWLSILRNTGLRNTHEADTVLHCARRIEFLGAESMMKHVGENFPNQVSLEIWSLAETLIETVLENSALLHDHNFCGVFAKIACVPAEKGFPLETGKRGVTRVLCSYSDAILLKDWPLAWTVAPILFKVPPDYSWGALQLRSPPPFTMVLKHLQAGTWFTGSSVYTIETVSFEVLKYLDKIWETLSSTDILELQQLAFIVADNGTRIATPGSLFARLSINLSPLASELPSHYLPFVKILKELGVEDMLSISCATNILSNLHKSCGCHRLNPNELHAVIELLQFLCDETIEPQTSERHGWESELVVPDDGCRLVRPNTCVYIDPHGSQYVNYIDSLKLRFVHRDVSERLCLAFGIRKLSNVVVEELDYVEHLETLEEAGSVSLAAIRLKLLSRSFQVAVSSVVNNFSRFTSGFQNPDFLTLQRSLKSVAKRLKFVKCIYTRFRLLPKFVDITCSSNESFIPESKSGSSHRTLYYVDRSYTCMLIAKQPNYTSVVDLVAIVVSHVLGSPIPLPIGSLFLCPQDSETALVNILKLSSDERVIEGVGHGTGFLGGHLLPRDEKKVHCNRARFCKGEIVAWQSQDGEKLKYGRIPEDVRLKLSGRSSYRLKVEIFPGMTNSLINSRVFHFGYLTIKEDSSTLGMPVESDNILSGIQQPEASVGVNLRNQIHAITEHKLGHVPADVFDQSVEEMCSVSGINMDPEKQCLLQTTLSLHQWLNTQSALVLQQEKSEMATKEANTTKRALQCRICLSSEIDITLVPCGHVLCRACTSDITCCPICGVELSKPMRSMFVGDK